MVDLTLVKDVVTIVGVIAGLTYYIMSVRNQNRTRQAQLFMQVYSKWTDNEFNENYNSIMNREWQDFDEWRQKYGRVNNPKENAIDKTVGQYFEGIGILVKKGLIDIELVDDMMSGLILGWWEKNKSRIIEVREYWNAPNILEWAEYLANEVKTTFIKQHPEAKDKYT